MIKFVIFLKKSLKINKLKLKKHWKVRDQYHYTADYRGAAHSIHNLKYSIPKEIPIVFHNGSNYEYHLIIKEQAEEFK